MEVFKEITPLREYLQSHKIQGKSIGLVPTMGALHSGHLALIRKAIEENDIVVCSIYVNPTQFNNSADLQSYPRELIEDLELLQKEGCHTVFTPSDEVMYPQETVLKVNFGLLENVMEGKFRPGHFNGVATVVSKLFHIVNPDYAYFGQKDLQQYAVIKQLVQDLSFPVQLRCVDIVREEDGLAKSSRNLRLSEEERKKSIILHQSLLKVADMLLSGSDIENCVKTAERMFELPGVQLEYFEIVDIDTLQPVSNISGKNSVAICVAAFIGEIRLIDNKVISLN